MLESVKFLSRQRWRSIQRHEGRNSPTPTWFGFEPPLSATDLTDFLTVQSELQIDPEFLTKFWYETCQRFKIFFFNFLF
jgi:hypothetical protein